MQHNLKHVEKIMPLCLALFFCRTVFIGYKYLFLTTFMPCILYSVYMLFKRDIVRLKIKTLLFPELVLALFFAHFSPLSNVVKESVNITVIMYFIAFSKLYYADDKCEVFLKWIVRFTLLAGCLAIVRFALSFFDILLPMLDKLFEGNGFVLVNDGNFYSLFFVISIILSIKLSANGQMAETECLTVNIVAVINIVAGLSRRAYALYAMLLTLMVVLIIIKKYDFQKTVLYNLLAVVIIALLGAGTIFFSSTYYSPEMSFYQRYRYYKMYSLIDNNTDFLEFDAKQSRCYYEKYHIEEDDENLFYNGDLHLGMRFWRSEHTPPDSIITTYTNDENNSFIRIEKKGSIYGWSLRYMGRPIYYNSGTEYVYSFKYRVIKGEDLSPFRVGLWVKERNGYIDNLKKEIIPYDSVWNICVVRHIFEKDQMNPTCFLNAQKPNTIIDIKDIRLTCDDTTGLPRYVDQLPDSVIHKYYSNDTVNYFTASRTDRWRYALELWQTRYDTKQKIFGQGFKYLEWYGERFWGNPNRHDFPHNPIISSFLYSGIIGGVLYIIFLIMSLWLYWKKRKTMGIFFIMYLCCMFFSMFSGSSHFSFPLFAFLSFLPFVEYKNDNNSCKDLPANA